MAKLNLVIIIEILGRPKERVTEALTILVDKLGKEKGVKVVNKTIHEPQPVKGSQTLFTTFAEVELELDSEYTLFGVIFAYMPSHAEIISPEKISLSNAELSDIVSRLSQRLHDYDAIAKKLVAEKEQLINKLYEVAPHLFQTQQQNQTPSATKKTKTKKAKKRKKS